MAWVLGSFVQLHIARPLATHLTFPNQSHSSITGQPRTESECELNETMQTKDKLSTVMH